MNSGKHVYFIQKDPDGLIKIGCSENPKRRLKELEHATGDKLNLIFIIKDAGIERESYLQEKFKKIRTFGEWFEPDKSIFDYIKKIESERFDIKNVSPLKRGRPRLNDDLKKSLKYTKGILLKLTEEQKGKLDVVARTRNQSVQQLLRELVDNEISKYEWIEK